MKKLLTILFATITIFSVQSQSANKLKKELLNSIEQKTTELTTLSDNIWEAAEVAFREDKSCLLYTSPSPRDS